MFKLYIGLLLFVFGIIGQGFSSEAKNLEYSNQRMTSNFLPFQGLTFFLQPYESEGTACKFEQRVKSDDYIVYCEKQKYSVHFFIRPFTHPKQESIEILLMLTDITNPAIASQPSMVSVWVKSSKGSEAQSVLVSMGVQNGTASLDIRATL